MQTNLLLLLVEISVISCLHRGNFIWNISDRHTHLENKKLKSTRQKNRAVDKCTNQLNIFSGVLYHWWYFSLTLAIFFPHFQLLCEWTDCNKRGFLEPWSTGYLCHSHIWSPGGALSCSIISMFSFQRVSREFKIKHHFLLAMNRDTQSLSSADIVY